MDVKLLCIACAFLMSFLNQGAPIRWLGIQRANLQWNDNPKKKIKVINIKTRSSCTLARKYYGFSKIQARLCRSKFDLMPHIQKAALLTSTTCKDVFKYRRWNCSSVDSAPELTPDLTRATREQAFVYAMSSASLIFTLARLCSGGSFYQCSCASHPKEMPQNDFKWGGCGDNLKWGTHFTRQFIHNTEKRSIDDKSKVSQKAISNVNLHNVNVGKRVITKSLATQCKCHGVSGSCSIKTCWKSLPYPSDIGHVLLQLYTKAMESSKHSDNGKRFSNDRLVYLTKSPDYCTKDKQLGSLGTVGRKCNVTSSTSDGCTQLCCGRGYKSVIEEQLERCQCKYYYCCYVKCKTCRTFVETHECN